MRRMRSNLRLADFVAMLVLFAVEFLKRGN